MNNPIYLSTGAFIGMKNNRNPRLLTEYAEKLDCDGFELMMFSNFYDQLDAIIADYLAASVKIPVIHTDKRIGNHLGSSEENSYETALDLFKINCETAAKLGTKKLVLHSWGLPDSDQNPTLFYDRVSNLLSIAAEYSLDLLVENCFCIHDSPLHHLTELTARHPALGCIIDTRCAQFHDELFQTIDSPLWQTHVRHLHINDYAGSYKQWDAINPIPQPGRGNIDWHRFFNLVQKGYQGSLTLEAPSILAEGVDTKTLNASLRLIRNGMNGKELIFAE